MALALSLASQMSSILEGKEKGVKRDAMRALASLLEGQFVLNKEVESQVANLVARSRPSPPKPVAGRKVKIPPSEANKPAEWKKHKDWIQCEETREELLEELQKFKRNDESVAAVAAREAYKAHLVISNELRKKLRA